MGKILASQVNLGFIELPCELAWCRKLQQAGNEEMETFRKGSVLRSEAILWAVKMGWPAYGLEGKSRKEQIFAV